LYYYEKHLNELYDIFLAACHEFVRTADFSSFLCLEQKLIIQNKDVLMSLRTSFDKPEQCLELIRRLKSKHKSLSRLH